MTKIKSDKRTEEELAEMNRVRQKRYYDKHREKEQRRNLKKYYDNKKLSDGDRPFKLG